MKKKGQIKHKIQINLKMIKCFFLLLLFLAPLNYGSFFEEKFWPLAMPVVLLLFCVFKKQGREIKFGIPDILLMFLCASYFLSFLGAVSPHQAYVGFLKYVFYFVICFLVGHLWSKEEQERKKVLLTMISAITLGTIFTFLAQADILIRTNFITKRRFCSTFQYPNTYAIMLVATILLTIYFYVVSTKKGERGLLLTGWFLNTVAFYATLSRGSLLVYFPALLVLLFSLEKEYRRLALGNLFLINVFGLISANFIIKNPNVKTLFILLVGIFLVLFLNLLVAKKRVRLSSVVGVISVLLLVGGVAVAQYFPEKVISPKITRLAEINLETPTVNFRFYLYKDALKIFQKHWLLGTGADGWSVLYRHIQGHLYNSAYVHSSVMQTMVESGLLGTLLFLGLFGFIFGQQIWRWKRQKSTTLEKIIFLALGVVFLHSFIDLDLSFTAVSMYLFVLVGLLGSEYRFKPVHNQSLRFVSLILAGVLFISVTSMGLAYFYSYQALASLRTNRLVKLTIAPQYERNLGKAQKLVPLNPLYSSHLGLIKIAKGFQQKSITEIEEGLEHLERAIELAPYQYETYITKGLVLGQLQRKEAAIPYFEKVITLMPMQNSGYQYAMENYVQLAIESGQKKYLDLARQLYARTVEQMQKVEPERLAYWEGEKLNEAVFINYYAGVVECLEGEYEKANAYFALALREPSLVMYEELRAWTVVNQEMQGVSPTIEVNPFYVKFAKSSIQKYRQKSERQT
jgi:O-antigen ligase